MFAVLVVVYDTLLLNYRFNFKGEERARGHIYETFMKLNIHTSRIKFISDKVSVNLYL